MNTCMSMFKELLALYWWVIVGWLLEAVGAVIKRFGQQLEEVGGRCRGRRVVVIKSESNIEAAERVVVKAESNIETAERVVVIAPGESILVKSATEEVEEASVICVKKPARSSQRSRGRGRGVTRGGRTPLVTTGW